MSSSPGSKYHFGENSRVPCQRPSFFNTTIDDMRFRVCSWLYVSWNLRLHPPIIHKVILYTQAAAHRASHPPPNFGITEITTKAYDPETSEVLQETLLSTRLHLGLVLSAVECVSVLTMQSFTFNQFKISLDLLDQIATLNQKQLNSYKGKANPHTMD